MTALISDQSLLKRNASLQTASDRSVVCAPPLTSLFQGDHFTIDRHLHGAFLVQDLLRSRRPSAILGRVRPIRINAIDTQSVRGFSHVGDEVVVVVTPALADINAARSIPLPSRRRRPSASGNHAAINPVGPICRVVPCVGVAAIRPPLLADMPARSTADGPAAAKMDEAHRSHKAAITPALDHANVRLPVIAADRRKLANNRPFAESRTAFERLRAWVSHRVHHTIGVTRAQAKDGATVLKAPK